MNLNPLMHRSPGGPGPGFVDSGGIYRRWREEGGSEREKAEEGRKRGMDEGCMMGRDGRGWREG